MKQLDIRRYFLAGGICCSFSHGVAVPFDVVKTRLQTSSAAEFIDTNVISGAQKLPVKLRGQIYSTLKFGTLLQLLMSVGYDASLILSLTEFTAYYPHL